MSDSNFDILFLCGSLQPGADGIGDYTRRLAGELAKNGKTLRLLAYNDRHISESIAETQNCEGIDIAVLRLPAKMAESLKTEKIKAWLKGAQPEWVSVQYVLYAFQDRGLPFSFARHIQSLFTRSKFQIMFHELWLGMEKKPLLKDRLYGFLQEHIIKQMVKRLNPSVVHTHSRTYLKLLKHHGISARHLPIISNIPVVNTDKTYSDIHETGPLYFLIFGFISPGAPVGQFASELKAFAAAQNREVKILFAGRNGAHLHEWLQAFDANGISYEQKGVLSVEQLSDLMNDSDIGISTTPMSLYEKSGSVAAMFKHGLPVINVAVDWEPEIIADFEINEPIIEYMPGMLSEWLLHLHKPGRRQNLKDVTKRFLEDIQTQKVTT